MTIELDFGGLARGDEFPLPPISYDAADVRAYLDATGEPAERWASVVPPLAAGAWVLGQFMEHVGLPWGALHVRQEFDFLHAITPGELVEASVSVAQRSERRGTLLLTLDIELRTAPGGDIVLRGRSTVAAPAPEATS